MITIRASNPPGGKRFFSSPKRQDRLWKPTESLIQRVPGYFPRMKASRSETTHSPPFNAEVKMSGAIPLLPLYAVKTWEGTLYVFSFYTIGHTSIRECVQRTDHLSQGTRRRSVYMQTAYSSPRHRDVTVQVLTSPPGTAICSVTTVDSDSPNVTRLLQLIRTAQH